MPFARPTIDQLKARAATSIASRMLDANGRPWGSLLPRGPARVLANTLGGMNHGAYGYLDWVALQLLPDTADPEFLERFAARRGVARKTSAPATGTVQVSGTAGAVVEVGTLLQRADGTKYSFDAGATLGGSPVDATVTAVEPGLAGNVDAGALLQFASPVPFVAATVTVVADPEGRGLSGGLDVESDARLLQRLRAVEQAVPQGGAVADYLKWALEVAGVTRAWVRKSWMGRGSVGLAFVLDDDPTSIIPPPEKVLEVQCYVDDPTRRPVTADFVAFAPTPLPVDFDVNLTPNVGAVRAAVTAALQDLLAREAELGAPLLVSHVREAVSNAAGEADSVVNTPAADVTALPYELAVPGTFTFH